MKITPAEAHVMDELWRDNPQGSEKLIATLGPAQNWSEATIRTLLGRLVKKQAVAADPDGRRYAYRPLIDRADYALSESEGLIDRLFDGRVSPFVVQFAGGRKLSAEDIAELKTLIEAFEDGQ